MRLNGPTMWCGFIFGRNRNGDCVWAFIWAHTRWWPMHEQFRLNKSNRGRNQHTKFFFRSKFIVTPINRWRNIQLIWFRLWFEELLLDWLLNYKHVSIDDVTSRNESSQFVCQTLHTISNVFKCKNWFIPVPSAQQSEHIFVISLNLA